MCLGVPARVTKIEAELVEVMVGGIFRRASLQLLEDVRVGDYVLLHAGFAIQKIDKDEAEETLRLLDEIY